MGLIDAQPADRLGSGSHLAAAATSALCAQTGKSFNRIHGRSFTAPLNTPHAGHEPARAACSMITFTVVAWTRCTSRTLNSCSRPNNTDVASDMLLASLLDVAANLASHGYNRDYVSHQSRLKSRFQLRAWLWWPSSSQSQFWLS
jgi:hypothetical protein